MLNKQGQTITNFLNQHGFKAKYRVEDFIKRNSRTFTSPIKDNQGNRLFIKAQLSPDTKIHQRFNKEIKVYERLLSTAFELPWLLTLHPELNYIDETSVIMVFDEESAQPLARERYLQKDKSVTEQEINKIIETIKSLRSIPLEIFDKSLLTQRTYDKYIKDIEKYHSQLQDQEAKDLCQRAKKLLVQDSSFLEQAPLVLCHGDLLLKNFLMNAKNNNFYLVDLEGLGVSFSVYDIVYLWNTMIFKPDLQELLQQKFFSEFDSNENSNLKALWKLTILKTALGEINLWEQEMLKDKVETLELSKEIIALHKNSINKRFKELVS